ncbi:MAG: class IV adenylate cyclase [Patescibacteria group bacterium]
MYEVEVKARLKDRKLVLQKLKSLGCTFGKELHQVDHVFIEEGLPFPPPPFSNVLRVRKQNDTYFFTLKIPQETRQDCIEREMEIKDGEMMIEILKLMKWQEVPTVDKKRIKTKVGDIEVVLDVVEHLGSFIEAEKIVKSEDRSERVEVQDELFAFLETLGVARDDRVIDGKYDIMLYEKLKGK